MPKSISQLRALKARHEKIACLTAYDASFAALLAAAEVDVVLVGDSLGMVIQGHDSTLPVTLRDMAYHCAQVRRGNRDALLIVDMPFMSYATPQQALDNAAFLMREGQAQMVKLEGGQWLHDTIDALTQRGVPVCAHLGLTPQSVHKFGGYKVQGRDEQAAEQILADAQAVQEAGADLLVLECVPSALATAISRRLEIPTIGIGAGPHCDGQVLVLYDMLGINPGKPPRFVKNFLPGKESITEALQAYVQEVKAGRFPAPEHCF